MDKKGTVPHRRIALLLSVAISAVLALAALFTVRSYLDYSSRARPSMPDSNELAAFLADCERGVSKWQVGQVDYPQRVPMDVGQSIAYVAAVDIRSNPLPAEKLIPGDTPQSVPVAVQCRLGARLVPVGKSLDVDNQNWILRQFTPTGILNWSWSVTAVAPGDHGLRLELEPAVTTQTADIIAQGGSSPNRGTFVTQVQVNASWIQHVGQWWKDNWGIIVIVAGSIGVALVAIVKWGGDLGQALRDSWAKWRRKRKEEGQT